MTNELEPARRPERRVGSGGAPRVHGAGLTVPREVDEHVHIGALSRARVIADAGGRVIGFVAFSHHKAHLRSGRAIETDEAGGQPEIAACLQGRVGEMHLVVLLVQPGARAD